MKDSIFGYGPAGITWILTAIQSDKILQYINLILAILATLVSIGYTVWKWWKKAKEDGKITEEEIEELKEEIKENLKNGD